MGCLRITHDQRSELRVVHGKKAVTSNDWVKRVRSSYLFGMLMPDRHDELSGRTYAYGFQGQERDDEVKGAGNAINFRFRMHDPRLGRFLSVDPLAEEREWLSPYNFVQNNPIMRIDPDGASNEIVITGENNSSLTIKTDLIDIKINASGIFGDLGGNYTLEGADMVEAGLNIVGIVDPAGVADVASASLQISKGEYGGAILSALGVIPYIGDLGKVGKIGKHVKTIDNAVGKQKAVKKYDVGDFNDLKRRSKVGDGLDLHHVPQKKPAGQVVDGYDPKTAPDIAIPSNQQHKAIPTKKVHIQVRQGIN